MTGLVGCGGADVEGEWEHEEASGSYSDDMSLDAEGNGTREMPFSVPVFCGDDMFEATLDATVDVEWTDRGEEEYELEFDCSDARISGEGGCEAITGCSSVEDFHRTKSRGSRFNSPTSMRAPSNNSSSFFLDSLP